MLCPPFSLPSFILCLPSPSIYVSSFSPSPSFLSSGSSFPFALLSSFIPSPDPLSTLSPPFFLSSVCPSPFFCLFSGYPSPILSFSSLSPLFLLSFSSHLLTLCLPFSVPILYPCLPSPLYPLCLFTPYLLFLAVRSVTPLHSPSIYPSLTFLSATWLSGNCQSWC
jgi:hypothetical protein